MILGKNADRISQILLSLTTLLSTATVNFGCQVKKCSRNLVVSQKLFTFDRVVTGILNKE